ncbi:hypothetical protein [Phytoactinopolyspora halotolerans]|uniref:hypothetical protein n=1 Tax=Phytoactinopolyspora halotolerans TaxID=1981512 RepID=UPI001C20B656|nr:hypothetical protein [Phytoactinopolyspora halotolerans]
MPRTSPRGDRLLAIYLNDHLAGATLGARRARYLAEADIDASLGSSVSGLAADIADDRAELMSIMRTLGIPLRRYKTGVAVAAELAGRLKPNGRVLQRSPLSTLEELELLKLGIEGKASGWRSLRSVAERDGRLSVEQIDHLTQRAEDQARRVEELRRRVAAETFAA